METRAQAGGIERKRILIRSSKDADLIAALARILGLEIASGPEESHDLVVLEADRVEDLPPASERRAPLMLIASRRLRYGEAEALRAAGARFVLDAEASLLDLAFALSELLFETISEQRRYWRSLGGAEVLYWRLGPTAESKPEVAHLVGLAREGGCLRASQRLPEGTVIEIALDLPSGPARIRGRVAYAAEDGFAVEFALDDQHVAPRLAALAAQAKRASLPPHSAPISRAHLIPHQADNPGH